MSPPRHLRPPRRLQVSRNRRLRRRLAQPRHEGSGRDDHRGRMTRGPAQTNPPAGVHDAELGDRLVRSGMSGRLSRHRVDLVALWWVAACPGACHEGCSGLDGYGRCWTLRPGPVGLRPGLEAPHTREVTVSSSLRSIRCGDHNPPRGHERFEVASRCHGLGGDLRTITARARTSSPIRVKWRDRSGCSPGPPARRSRHRAGSRPRDQRTAHSGSAARRDDAGPGRRSARRSAQSA